MLSIVNYSELSRVHFSLVTLQTIEELSVLSIEHPHELVLAARDQDIALWVPLKEIQVLTWAVFKGTLELKILHIPHPDLVVHASSCQQTAIMIELNELYCLSVTRKVFMYD